MTDNLSERAATSKPILLDGCETDRQNPYHTTGGNMHHCTDCRHYAPPLSGMTSSNAKCTRNVDQDAPSPVDGQPITGADLVNLPGILFCVRERFSDGSYSCGAGARFFEPADTHDHRDGQSTAGKAEHDLDVTGRELKAGT